MAINNDPRLAMASLKKEIKGDINSFFDDLHKELRKNTPVDTGRARRGWTKTTAEAGLDLAKGTIILHNDVHYVQYLDKGSSGQSPRGIVEPSLRTVLRKYS